MEMGSSVLTAAFAEILTRLESMHATLAHISGQISVIAMIAKGLPPPPRIRDEDDDD